MPSRMMGTICPRFMPGSLPSMRQVSKGSSAEAMTNLAKAADKGWISRAMTRPAMKVPPQNTAMSNSFT